MKKKLLSAILIVVVSSVVFSCSKGHVRYDPVTGVVKKDNVEYKIGKLGPEWRKIKGNFGDEAFFNDGINSSISVNAICPFRGDPPLRVLLNHLLFGFTDRKIQDTQTIQMQGREALRAVYSAKLDGVERKFLVYILKKDTCVYDLEYQSSEANFDKGVTAFEEFVKAFKTEK